ncbi:MAG: extracellular solute-binding protein [Candidatus Cloacimonetes bacterium]|nr:extracellular solute-binding protein [Candidatus Cloacimonadota bacterium]
MRHARWILIVLCFLAVIGIVWQLVSVSSEPESSSTVQKPISKTVVLYTSLPEHLIEEIILGFEKSNPMYVVKAYHLSAGLAHTKIASEKSGDVVWLSDPSLFRTFIREGLLASSTEQTVKEPFGLDGRYVRIGAASPIVFAASEDTRLPKSWAELLQSSSILIADPSSSGTALSILNALADNPLFGMEYINDLSQSNVTVLSGIGPVAYAVGKDKGSIGILTQDMVHKASGDVAYSEPEDFRIIMPFPIAMFRDASEKDGAEALMAYILSEDGQKIVESEGFLRGSEADVMDTGELMGRREMLRYFNELFLPQ